MTDKELKVVLHELTAGRINTQTKTISTAAQKKEFEKATRFRVDPEGVIRS